MRSISVLPIILALLTIAGVTAASTTSEVIKLRQGNFKEIGGAFKTINDELKSRGPDMNSVRPAAHDLATRSSLANEHFPEGSGPESGVETRAKAAIWEDREQFMSIMDAMAVAATDLKNAVAARDLAEMRRARDDLGNSCKSCHDDFRVPD